MHTFTVQRTWLDDEGYRLDPRSYAEGALAVRNRITSGPLQWYPLERVARIFRGPLHKRVYVTDPDRGVPYLTGADVSQADLPRNLKLSALLTPELPILRVQAGWTLISSAGTVGNATFVRPEMEAFAVSQDMLRVAPFDPDTEGYIFAFLASQGARALLRLRTYGSVVDRIEPKHIADLPVPFPEPSIRHRIHALVKGAADARTEVARLLDEAARYFDDLAGPMPSVHEHAYAVGIVPRSKLGLRLDAFPHVGWAAESKPNNGDEVGDLGDIVSTQRVPRIYAARGVPFLSGIDIFRIRPVTRVNLAKHVADSFGARVARGELAIQGSGQRYGLVGQAAYIGERLDGWSASHDLFRIRTGNPNVTARIFAFLRSSAGRRAMLRHSYGTSIPHVNPEGIAAVRVPALSRDLERLA